MPPDLTPHSRGSSTERGCARKTDLEDTIGAAAELPEVTEGGGGLARWRCQTCGLQHQPPNLLLAPPCPVRREGLRLVWVRRPSINGPVRSMTLGGPSLTPSPKSLSNSVRPEVGLAASVRDGQHEQRPVGVHPATGLQLQSRLLRTPQARRQDRDAAPRTKSTPRSTPPGPLDGTRSGDSPATPQLSLHLLPRDRRRRVRLMGSEPSVELRLHLVGDGHILGLFRDTIPQILHIEDALSLGHLIEGAFHRAIAVAADPSRQIHRVTHHAPEVAAALGDDPSTSGRRQASPGQPFAVSHPTSRRIVEAWPGTP